MLMMGVLMQPDADLIILGGGCAGLSLALHLAELGDKCPKILILESRSEYTNDRTWCFWDCGSAALSHLSTQSWVNFSLQTAGRSVFVNCPSLPYKMITGLDFYEYALKRITLSQKISIMLDNPVISVPKKEAGLWCVNSSLGLKRAPKIVDTRPQLVPQKGQALLWQSFLGHEIECDQATFDPTKVALMHFRKDHRPHILFTYVLPFTKNRALIEVTVFGQDPLKPDALANELESIILERLNNTPYTIIRSEHGILPMGQKLVHKCSDPTYVHAGLMAGGARPSTGYAFQRIQRWSKACAKTIAEGKNPIGHLPSSKIVDAMDTIFLRVIRSNPKIAPELFTALFSKVDSSRLIRFLSDEGSFADLGAIISSLPAVPFLKELPRTFMSKLTKEG